MTNIELHAKRHKYPATWLYLKTYEDAVFSGDLTIPRVFFADEIEWITGAILDASFIGYKFFTIEENQHRLRVLWVLKEKQ